MLIFKINNVFSTKQVDLLALGISQKFKSLMTIRKLCSYICKLIVGWDIWKNSLICSITSYVLYYIEILVFANKELYFKSKMSQKILFQGFCEKKFFFFEKYFFLLMFVLIKYAILLSVIERSLLSCLKHLKWPSALHRIHKVIARTTEIG